MLVKNLLATLLAVGLLTGCSDQRVLNKINLIQTMGLDSSDQGVKSTVLIGSFKKKGETDIQVLNTVADTTFDIAPKLSLQSKNIIEYGQLGLVIFSQSYARQGIGPALESLCRSQKISSSMLLGVTDSTASELLAKAQKSQDSYYLCDMIDQNIKYGILPRNNLQETLFQYYGEGRDLFLPYFVSEGDDIRIEGLALFKDDKFVTKIGNNKVFLLKLLMQTTKNGNFLVPLAGEEHKEENYIQFSSTGSGATFKLDRLNPVPSIHIHVRLSAQAKQYPSGIDFNSKEQISKLESDIGAYFEDELQQFLAFCQKKSVDPVGIGDFVRSKTKDWNAAHFAEIYPKIELKVNVHFTIVQPVMIQ
ncbi:Ger(x)C family spore germination protein [Paenibacillus qinlingensis]|uniref:Ger(x)C family spore germination protein n=1 Tax=Paenibacillus qinlingensis TaxID=1837343 RepID=UPI0015635175|nr:Ger(x)C family spore germination protein [Paenibacillus qinlingensis]NQX62741.1 Ger(x)C family spore germination protein [Paenibacillus qinlingensis]